MKTRRRQPWSWRAFWKDQRGVSAVEFALIAPLLITLYMGLAETTEAMMAKRRAGHVASTIGDLVAQQQSMDDTTMADLFTIGATVLAPFPADKLSMRVSSVVADSSGKVTVAWSKPYGSGMSKLDKIDGIPAGLISAGQSLIVSDVSYSYESPLKRFIPNALTWTDRYYLRPRQTTAVTFP